MKITKQQNLEAWSWFLVEFKLKFKASKISGLCGFLSDLWFFYRDSENRDDYKHLDLLIDEVDGDVNHLQKKSTLSVAYLFTPFEYESRLDYIENKIKKYSDQSDAAEPLK